MKINIAFKYRPFIESSDFEILELMNDLGSKEDAFNELFQRYKSYVLKVCQKGCFGFAESNSLANDIFQQTFTKVYFKSYTFKPKEGGDKTNISADIKAWLSRIARNELINYLRKNPDEKLTIAIENKNNGLFEDSFFELPGNIDANAIELEKPNIQKDILEKCLNLLSASEKEVLMTYMLYYDPRFPKRHLPDEIIKNLCKRINVKAGSLRQIKLRALKKLKSLSKASSLQNSEYGK